ncbi:hypothetical protein V6N13_062480 [Hibiscus sabdariffa]
MDPDNRSMEASLPGGFWFFSRNHGGGSGRKEAVFKDPDLQVARKVDRDPLSDPSLIGHFFSSTGCLGRSTTT